MVNFFNMFNGFHFIYVKNLCILLISGMYPRATICPLTTNDGKSQLLYVCNWSMESTMMISVSAEERFAASSTLEIIRVHFLHFWGGHSISILFVMLKFKFCAEKNVIFNPVVAFISQPPLVIQRQVYAL